MLEHFMKELLKFFNTTRNMYPRIIVVFLCLWKISADNIDDVIIDYFVHKEAPSVVALTCNEIQDDLLLLRDFNTNNIKALISKSSHGLGINLFAHTDYWKLGFFLDTRCLSTDEILSIFFETTNYRMYDELHQWLILGDNLTDLVKIVNDNAFGLSTDFMIVVPKNTDRYELYDVYNTFKERGTEMNITFYGEWNKKNNFSLSLTQPKYNRRANLHGLTLKAIYFKCTYKLKNQSLDNYYEDYQHATRDARSKFGYQILKHLSDLYNFNLESIEASKWKPDDPMGPVGRAVVNGHVDFTGSPLTLSVVRTYVMKYVHQDWPFRTVIIFRNPQPCEIKVREIFRPLADNVWFSMIFIIIVIITALTFALKYDYYETSLDRISNSFLITIGALCQQGTNLVMERLASRIIFLFLLIFGLLMYTYYSASVVSARLDDPIYKINDSLEEFVKLNMKMKSELIAYQEYLLNYNKETRKFKKEYWSKIQESELYAEPQEGIQRVRDGHFAYHLHPIVGYPIIDQTYSNREICELMEVHLGMPILTAFGVTMNSTIVEISRVGLSKITEVGLRKRQILRWQYRKPECRRDILSASSVNIYEFLPHLILLLIGIVFAMFMCLLEIIFVKYFNYILTSRRSQVTWDTLDLLVIKELKDL